MKRTALAIVAHPDDIEFRMAGTMLLLRQAGWDLHYMTVANGSCGSQTMSRQVTIATRRKEAQAAAKLMGATWHPSICDDLEVVYEVKLLRRLAAVVREVRPTVVLTHPPVDYMEDHVNACRLALTAAFARGAPNFVTTPRRPHYDRDVVVYHCTPHGMCDGLRRPMTPEFYVDTTAVHEQKLAALAQHKSQRDWLLATQGFDAMTAVCGEESHKIARMAGGRRWRYAEGWWRHLHLGYAGSDFDPLREALGKKYKRA